MGVCHTLRVQSSNFPAAEKFITAAEVNTVGRKSLDDIIAQLHKQAESSDAN